MIEKIYRNDKKGEVNKKGIKIFVGTELLFISEEYCKTIISICDINKSITR